ncbi:MAG: pyruvate:ferredoxin (flavodoxin) oxidoreductase [Oscillospiraceae bacterium]|jgi:pyruvate-ferredoxin/flavodoxin oxidoreductase|nr:pyruvate:ferredoxin (flavodoxin) oxidoreductase [Oscillospiraceae bacterium]
MSDFKSNIIFETLDGNEAAAHASYAFTDVAAIYPITPSSKMAEKIDEFSASGKKNIFGNVVSVRCMQSEAGVAGAMHGSLASGALATTYTASQGLLLMIPNMYKMAGELLPGVIHVSSRTIATHSLSIFGDHSDIYACRQTGFAILCSNTPQEVMDFATVAHLSSIKSRIPFIHFFDGFRTSHEIQKIRIIDYKDLKEMIDEHKVNEFKQRGLTPEKPVLRGSAQNDDIFFQAREACNTHYDNLQNTICYYLDEINKRYKTNYEPFNYYGDKEATNIIVAMGSVCETIEEVVDYLRSRGEKVGLIKTRLYRPFLTKYLLKIIPKTVKNISVLDRTKEPGSVGEPLYLDVFAAIKNNKTFVDVRILRGRYGLASKDTGPSEILSVYKNMKKTNCKDHFTIGINDDVTLLSLSKEDEPEISPKNTICCKFWGFGSDGTISANKNSIKIIGNKTQLHVQGYFAYDSKKSGGLTVSHLRFGPSRIKSTYYVRNADFIACHNSSYVYKYNMLKDLKKSGKFLLNCTWKPEELSNKLPCHVIEEIIKKNIDFYIINGAKISYELGLGEKINTVLQAAFFKILNFIDEDKIKKYMKDAASAQYIKKGEKIVFMNHQAIEYGMQNVVKIDLNSLKILKKIKNTKPLNYDESASKNLVKYVENIMIPINKYEGNKLAVSNFLPYVDGTFPQGSAAFEKRAAAIKVPAWNQESCIQCNFCSYICPHAVIRPAILDEKEVKNAPNKMKMKDFLGFKNLKFSIVISVKDCTNCGCCVKICPAIKPCKALEMKTANTQTFSQEFFDYSLKLKNKPEVFEKFGRTTVKGSQFSKPLLEFSSACAGCGQTPYAKLATQLFGEDMIIANATGCSSIWGGSSPTTPYTTNKNGNGPAWQNSLFEDNAEFAFGISLAKNTVRKNLSHLIEEIFTKTENENLKKYCKRYFETKENREKNKQASNKLLKCLEETNLSKDLVNSKEEILKNRNFLTSKSIWMFGGDGWAYDIGFGGIDHVIASLDDINILIFDTEIYSNTGGQVSKATPMASSAKFAISGKETKKKDLAMIFINYEQIYVAQVAMGADFNQCIKAFEEAQSYNGPSVIIAYAPCISHGIKGGMSNSILEEKEAVKSGYWNLFRFDPRLAKENKNPFLLDSKTPSLDYQDFIAKETRYNSLQKMFPERAKSLFAQASKLSKEKYEKLLKMSKKY